MKQFRIALFGIGGGFSFYRNCKLKTFCHYQAPLMTETKVISPHSPEDAVDKTWITQTKFGLRICGRIAYLGYLYLPLFCAFPIWYATNNKSDWWLRWLRHCLENSGPMYIKFGQWISSRSDILPLWVCQVFVHLQSSVKPHSFKYTKYVIESTCFESIDELFAEFDQVPVGVGAVAQVHTAVLKKTQEKVAIKVLHPNVREILELDFCILERIGSWIDALPIGFQYLGIVQEIQTFKKMMLLQTDLRVEGSNLVNEHLTFPNYLERYSSKNILVESFINGVLLQKFLQFNETPYHPWIAYHGLAAFVQMTLKDNFCHADMHPGNIMVTFLKGNFQLSAEEMQELQECSCSETWRCRMDHYHKAGYTPRLILLDVGLVNELSTINMTNLQDCFQTALEKDSDLLSNLFIRRSKYPEMVIDVVGFKQKMAEMVDSLELDKRGRLLLSELFAIDIVQKFSRLVRAHHITLDGDFSGLLCATMIVEGIGRSLNANLDVLPVISDYFNIPPVC
jgi:aarF domain-containing kinase